MNNSILDQQKKVCEQYNVKFVESPESLKVGISKNVKEGATPINGMRHPIEGDTTGWYIWGGEEMSNDPDFFLPVHVDHLAEWSPQVLKFLGLPPGMRFLISGEYEDVWEDKNLLNNNNSISETILRGINNQWTHLDENSTAHNNNVWQVGIYEVEGITFAGIFDHLLVDDEHTLGLEEGLHMEFEKVSNLMIEVAKNLIPENSYIYADLIVRLSNNENQRPSHISTLRWLVSSPKKKFEETLRQNLSEDNIEVLNSLDNSGYITLGLSHNKGLLNKYYTRLGSDPDESPDILLLAAGEVNVDKIADAAFVREMGRKSISRLTKEDLHKWHEILSVFSGILFAVDGHIYFATRQKSKEEVLSSIESISKQNGLIISKNHILY